MHEYQITKNIINIAIDEAKKVDAKSITQIVLVIGDLSSILDESVQIYFDLLSEGTQASGATLKFKRIAAEFECRECKNIYNKPRVGFNCPICGLIGILRNGAKEFYIESIEVD